MSCYTHDISKKAGHDIDHALVHAPMYTGAYKPAISHARTALATTQASSAAFVVRNYDAAKFKTNHVRGHCPMVQGPLYLPVIAINETRCTVGSRYPHCYNFLPF